MCLNRYEYHWADGTTVKKPIKCSAPKYIEYLMQWVQEQLDDETIFPSKIGMLRTYVGLIQKNLVLCNVYAYVLNEYNYVCNIIVC